MSRANDARFAPSEDPIDTTDTTVRPDPSALTRGRRLLLAGIGILLVGLGAVGAVLPGLPTTVFLLGASWCFARSCPWLEERLLRARLFRPFRAWLRPGERVSRRTKASSMAVMWIAIAISATLLVSGDPPRLVVAGVVVALGCVGTWFIATHGRQAT
jgi:uncharacterized membrane protein YbaN (DUF454 family)